MSSEIWEQFAQSDPLWAILSAPDRKGRRWEIGEFFNTGRREISVLLYQLSQLGADPERNSALDFGCGVGRLTQALCESFETVVGVDISATMIRLAARLNRYPLKARYVQNDADDLRLLSSQTFDFVYSDLVLQHVEPNATVKYLRELFRVMRTGAVLVFQLPSHRREHVEREMTSQLWPPQAYRADIRVLSRCGPQVGAGAQIELELTVRNVSGVMWRTTVANPIRVGNHWLDASGNTMLIQDDGRTSLPTVVPAGEACRVILRVHTPVHIGQYVCEVDVVHEGISWFGDKGSTSCRIPLSVGAEHAHDAPSIQSPGALTLTADDSWPDIYEDLPTDVENPGDFPMHGIKQDDVIALLRSEGGSLFHVEQDERCGSEWVGYRYFVRKLSS